MLYQSIVSASQAAYAGRTMVTIKGALKLKPNWQLFAGVISRKQIVVVVVVLLLLSCCLVVVVLLLLGCCC